MHEFPKQIQCVLVTGAGGAVGRMVVDVLLRVPCDLKVVATDLPGRLPGMYDKDARIVPVEADLTCDAGFAELEYVLRETTVDAIIHTAAIVDIAQPYSALRRVNVELPGRLYVLGMELGAAHFVHISSASIYAEPAPGDDIYPLSEGFDLDGSSPYEWSKIHSEELLTFLRRTEEDAPVLTILRPSLIYGPCCRYLGAALAAVPSILGKISQRVIGFSGGPETNWVHCEDVARAAIHSLTLSDWADNGIYNVCPNRAVGFGEVITEHLIASDLDVVATIPLPQPSTLRLFRPVLERRVLYDGLNCGIAGLWSFFGPPSNRGGLLVKIDHEAVPYAFKHTLFDAGALCRTGFDFRWSLRAGIRNAIDWYRQHGWI